MAIKRSQIYYVAFDPVFGREIGGFKLRPVVVVSRDDINDKRLTITVVPGTSQPPRGDRRNFVLIDPEPQNGLQFPTFFLCHQLRALDHGRFVGYPIGTVSADDMDRLRDAIRLCLLLK